MRVIAEREFAARLDALDMSRPGLCDQYDLITGPGRSGAIAAAYASHALGIPFLPYGQTVDGKRVLIIDTVTKTGRTLRKAERLYGGTGIALFSGEAERLVFWYEARAMDAAGD